MIVKELRGGSIQVDGKRFDLISIRSSPRSTNNVACCRCDAYRAQTLCEALSPYCDCFGLNVFVSAK